MHIKQYVRPYDTFPVDGFQFDFLKTRTIGILLFKNVARPQVCIRRKSFQPDAGISQLIFEAMSYISLYTTDNLHRWLGPERKTQAYSYTVWRRGSNASRMPSPVNVTVISVTTRADTTEADIHQASMFCHPWDNSSPHEGVGAGSPNPR